MATTQLSRPISTKAAKTGIVASVLFVALLFVLQALQPEHDPTWRFLSEYALGRGGWLMTIAFASLGVACVSGIVLFWNQARDLVGRIGSVMLGITAVGVILAAVFVTDPITTPIDKLSTSGSLHNLGAQMNLTTFAILFLTISLARKEAWKPVRTALWIVSALCIVTDIAFIASIVSAQGVIEPGVYAGILGRTVLTIFSLWMVIAGVHAVKLHAANK